MATRTPKVSKKTSAPITQDNFSTMSRDDLHDNLISARRDLFTLTMKHSIRELKQPHLIRLKRREIAQISTFLSAQ